MALIFFYDATELDKEQLSNALRTTDHHWEYVDDKISLEKCNPNAEVISVFTTSNVTREMMESMPKLAVIACRSTGFNHIDLEAASDMDITVVNVPTYGESTVAEYAFTLLLSLTRKIQEVLDSENEQIVMTELTGQDLAGKTFGVIGTGHIGQKAIQVSNGFGMRTIAYDKFPNKKAAKEFGYEHMSLEEVLKQSDFITLHLPYLPSTHHILNKERISLMKKGAIVVNTGRGQLVDTRALLEALDSGHLGGAALDVIEGEQLLDLDEETALILSGKITKDILEHSVEISALKKMPNVIVSPHNAFNTVEAIGRINQTTVSNIIGFYRKDGQNKVEYKPQESGKLLLLRHTESEWNSVGVWSGIADTPISEKGKQDCLYVGKALKDLGIRIDVAFHTKLGRTKETLDAVTQVASGTNNNIEVFCDDGMMERDYGEYTGQDKWKMKEKLGEEQWTRVRRGWDVPIPNGETLKDTYERVVPFYMEKVLPHLKKGKNVLLVGHGNSFRALMKYVESISDEDIEKREMLINSIVVYDVDSKSGLETNVRAVYVDTPTGKSVLA
jgi:D-lactate dehydrogenase